MDIDHIFIFVDQGGPELATLQRVGLVETYRREHMGQGTANACFAFDPLFLELLWLTNESEAHSSRVARTRLWERSQWRTLGTCPIGVAFRGDLASLGVPFWSYRPLYLDQLLPAGVGIQVAIDSDDPMQPMLFSFPGSTAPCDWPPTRRGSLQRAGGWRGLSDLSLHAPATWRPCTALRTLGNATGLRIINEEETGFRLTALLEPLVPDAARLPLCVPAG